MLLGHGESLLRSAYAVADGGDGAESPKGPGVLYVTTARIVFEAPVTRSRIVRRAAGETVIQLDVSLHELRNVSVRRGRIARPRLVLELDRGRPSFDVLEPEAWAGTIAQAKRGLPGPQSPVASVVHTIERQVVKVRSGSAAPSATRLTGDAPRAGPRCSFRRRDSERQLPEELAKPRDGPVRCEASHPDGQRGAQESQRKGEPGGDE